MSDNCNDPHPNDKTILCQKSLHPYGRHYNADQNMVWDGLPMPVRTKVAGNHRVKKVIDSIESNPENIPTGPPVSGEQRRDEGMGRVLFNTDQQYKVAFARQYRVVVNSGQPFTSEDITAVVGMPPGHRNAVGAQFSALLRPDLTDGLVVYLNHVKARKVNQNATKIGQYQKVVP